MEAFEITDQGLGVFDTENITLDKSDNDAVTVGIDDSLSGDITILKWYLGADAMGSENTVKLYPDEYTVGNYTLNLAFEYNGTPWFGTIRFKVVE
jgi:hypothetical protein